MNELFFPNPLRIQERTLLLAIGGYQIMNSGLYILHMGLVVRYYSLLCCCFLPHELLIVWHMSVPNKAEKLITCCLFTGSCLFHVHANLTQYYFSICLNSLFTVNGVICLNVTILKHSSTSILPHNVNSVSPIMYLPSHPQSIYDFSRSVSPISRTMYFSHISQCISHISYNVSAITHNCISHLSHNIYPTFLTMYLQSLAYLYHLCHNVSVTELTVVRGPRLIY